MYTIHYDLWTPSRHPPPLRPLPPLPQQTYLTPPKPFLQGSLLFHRVPSPSLRFDMADLYTEPLSRISSAQEPVASYPDSSRNSISSLIEFTESLLPPSPHLSRPITPANPVECRLQEHTCKLSDSQSISPVSKRSANPDQLDQLCSKFEYLQRNRRDSAMFDVTQVARSTTRRGRTELDIQNNSSAFSALARAGHMTDLKNDTEPPYPPQNAVAQSHQLVVQQGESSFMDWDEEVTGLAKVKKSIADLKAVARSRAHSAPTTPAKSEVSFESACSILDTGVDIVMTKKKDALASQVKPQEDALAQHFSPTNRGGGKNSRRRKTVFVMDSTRRLSHIRNQKGCLSTEQNSSASKRKRVSFVESSESSAHNRGLSKLSHWMKKVIRCS